ncbi:MAG: hypothetical protein JNK72_24810 [Myxococcales bacterium]|nr:hypothetical protein [Myxococcales bacterium]
MIAARMTLAHYAQTSSCAQPRPVEPVAPALPADVTEALAADLRRIAAFSGDGLSTMGALIALGSALTVLVRAALAAARGMFPCEGAPDPDGKTVPLGWWEPMDDDMTEALFSLGERLLAGEATLDAFDKDLDVFGYHTGRAAKDVERFSADANRVLLAGAGSYARSMNKVVLLAERRHRALTATLSAAQALRHAVLAAKCGEGSQEAAWHRQQVEAFAVEAAKGSGPEDEVRTFLAVRGAALEGA